MERSGLHRKRAARRRELLRRGAVLLILAGVLNLAQFSFGAEGWMPEHFEETLFEQDGSGKVRQCRPFRD